MMLETLALQQLDRLDEASASYLRGLSWHAPEMAGVYGHDVMITEFLRREAEAGFDGNVPVAEEPSLVEDYISTFAGRWVCETEAEQDIEGYMKKGEIVQMAIVQTPLPDGTGLQTAWQLAKDGVVRGRSHGIAVWDPESKTVKTFGSATGGYHVKSEVRKVDGKWVDHSVVVYPDGASASSSSTLDISDNGHAHTFRITQRVNREGDPLPDTTDVWRRVSKNHEVLSDCLGWIIGSWEDADGTSGLNAKWISGENAIQFEWYNPQTQGVSLILWDSSDETVKMRGAASNGSNGDATLAMDGDEAVWTNVSYDGQGERTVAVLRFIPQDEGATCRIAWKDPKTGEEKELIVMKR
jgi:hypothetical protein